MLASVAVEKIDVYNVAITHFLSESGCPLVHGLHEDGKESVVLFIGDDLPRSHMWNKSLLTLVLGDRICNSAMVGDHLIVTNNH